MAFTFDQVKEVLKFHEESITRFFMTHIERLEKKIDEVKEENTVLKNKVNQMENSAMFQSEVFDEKMRELLNSDRSGDDNIKKEIEEIKNNIDELEDRSRRNNLRIVGVKEDRDENWDQTEEKVKELIKENLQITTEVKIERAHRVGSKKYKDGTKNHKRPIVVKFLSYKDKANVLNRYKEKKLWEDQLYINEDYSDSTSEKRKKLFERGKLEKNNGKIFKVVYKKLYVKDNEAAPWRICL